MKARQQHVPFGENVDPSAFDYTLLNHLYIHDDGNDVIDFGGFTTTIESTHEVQALLKNRSFIGLAASMTAAAAVAAAAASMGPSTSAFLHLQGDEPTAAAGGPSPPTAARAVREASRLVSVEDTDTHIWLVTQASEDRPPYARMFSSPDSLMAYIEQRGMELPARGQRRKLSRQSNAASLNSASVSPLHHIGHSSTRSTDKGDMPFPLSTSRREQGPLPTTKWIDVQVNPQDPNAAAMLRKLLGRFPLDETTVDNCLYLTPHDHVDITHLSSHSASYAFFTIACTPLQGIDYTADGRKGATAAAVMQRLRHRFRRRRDSAPAGDADASTTRDAGASANAATATGNNNARKTKGVMEMRFEAVRLELPRSAVPDPIPVAMVAFADWVITIHEKPFAEMDDLLRIIQLHCSPRYGPSCSGTGASYYQRERNAMNFANRAGVALSEAPQQRFTSTFVFVNLLQISIGHHLDSVALAQAVDELGDVVFEVKRTGSEQDRVLQRITAVRRCFGECGADVTRRESIVATLLQPNLAHNFLVRGDGVREQLLNAQAHIRYVQHELSDCRDTVAVSNWYHNVALQWMLLRRGNSALRQLLQLTEMANIMYPVITLQTLYSMNVPVPYQADGETPNTSLVPFFVVAAVIAIYTLLCGRAMYRIFKRTPFKTRLLA